MPMSLIYLLAMLSLQCWALTYQNPIVKESGVDLGDPGALFLNGAYYLATSSGDSPDAFPIHRSTDLAHWEHVGYVFPDYKSRVSWASGKFWAPDLQLVNGRIACYFSAKAPGGLQGILSLGVAFADEITGPFVDLGQPLWEDHGNQFGTIDVHYHETNGEKYLVWKKNQNVAKLEFSAHLLMRRLNNEGTAFADTHESVVLAVDQPWEKSGCIEAPWIIERSGHFFLFYSGSMVTDHTYAIGVARAPSIMGPYEKKKGPILHSADYSPPSLRSQGLQNQSEVLYTPGHNSVLQVAGSDRWVIFYHGREFADKDTHNRVLLMDELKWDGEGWPFVEGAVPSTASLPVPSKVQVV